MPWIGPPRLYISETFKLTWELRSLMSGYGFYFIRKAFPGLQAPAMFCVCIFKFSTCTKENYQDVSFVKYRFFASIGSSLYPKEHIERHQDLLCA